MEYVKLYLDTAALGCGYRALVILDQGHKLAHAVEPVTGTLVKFPKENLRNALPIKKPRWRKLAAQVQLARRRGKMYGWRIADKQLAEIAARLKAFSKGGEAP